MALATWSPWPQPSPTELGCACRREKTTASSVLAGATFVGSIGFTFTKASMARKCRGQDIRLQCRCVEHRSISGTQGTWQGLAFRSCSTRASRAFTVPPCVLQAPFWRSSGSFGSSLHVFQVFKEPRLWPAGTGPVLMCRICIIFPCAQMTFWIHMCLLFVRV